MRAPWHLRREDWACVAVLVALPALFLAPSLFGGKVLLPADLMLLSSPWREAGARDFPGFRQAHNGMFDPLHQHYPWKVYLSRSFRAGRVPLWNPYVYCGQPFAATGQPAVFYPPNVLFALIDPARAFGYVAFLHLVLAGLGLYALTRELGCPPAAGLAGAIAFQFCGLFVVTLEFTSYLATAAWLPLIVLALRRVVLTGSPRWTAVGGVVVGLQLLAGHMQFAVYALSAAAVCTAFFLLSNRGGWRQVARRGLLALAAAGLGLGLAALHLLPCLEMGLLSARRGAGTYEGALTQAMPSRQLLGLLIPDPYGNPVECGDIFRFIENYPYLGLGTLFLLPAGLFGPRRREAWFFAGLFVVGLLLAFGTHANWVFFKLVPGFSQLTGLGRAIYLSAFAGGVGAALGIEALLTRARTDGAVWLRRYAKIAGATAFAATAALLGFGLVTLQSPNMAATLAPFFQQVARMKLAPPEVLAAARDNTGLLQPYAVDTFLAHLGRRIGAFLALVTALLTATVALAPSVPLGDAAAGGKRQRAQAPRSPLGPKVAPWVFAAVIAADLCLYGFRFNPQLPEGMLRVESPALSFLQSADRPVRVVSVASDGNPLHRLSPNLGMVYDLQEVNGSDSLYTRAFARLFARIADPQHPGFPQPDPASPVLSLLSVRYIATEADLDSVAGLRRVTTGRFHLYENTGAFPRAWIATATRSVGDYAAALDAVCADPLGLRRSVVAVGPGAPPADREGDVKVVRYEPQRVSLQGDLPARSWVVLADACYPGWRAWVDGAPAEVQRAGYVLRGVRMPRDAKRLELLYAPTSFVLGQFVSGLAAAIIAGLLVAFRRREEP